MTMLDEQIAIMQAAKDGKTVQCRLLSSKIYVTVDDPQNKLFNFQSYAYRVKPELTEVTVRLGAGEHPDTRAWLDASGKLVKVELI